ncbi:ribosomal protein S18-alanine N-acetyltransferase [uncultured Ruminococcus sp.]|uniref:ribosomal protein S18-alanine N-acetyltransferase n=1 Tax=uncultured Ruminococcus sp. TaxID=165186 RepID=UPI0026270424|nr:ribosomal protein S18-alanine N-acetyltransferase [uncultured Ruminococcus sp.]
MMQRVKVIGAESVHLPVIAEIAGLSFPDPWSETLFRQTLESENHQIWCAVSGETVCGYLVLSRAGTEMSVDDIAVHPAFRRQGVGKLLLEWTHGQYPACDFWLEVRESNAAAMALYQSLGYTQVGFRKRYYQNPEEGAVLMTRVGDHI